MPSCSDVLPTAPHSSPRQEVIIQNFKAKQGTAMAGAPEPPLAELLWTVAVARLLLGPEVRWLRGAGRGFQTSCGLSCSMSLRSMNSMRVAPAPNARIGSCAVSALQMSIQAPPNLTPEPDDVAGGEAGDPAAGWRALLDAGINDWGGEWLPLLLVLFGMFGAHIAGVHGSQQSACFAVACRQRVVPHTALHTRPPHGNPRLPSHDPLPDYQPGPTLPVTQAFPPLLATLSTPKRPGPTCSAWPPPPPLLARRCCHACPSTLATCSSSSCSRLARRGVKARARGGGSGWMGRQAGTARWRPRCGWLMLKAWHAVALGMRVPQRTLQLTAMAMQPRVPMPQDSGRWKRLAGTSSMQRRRWRASSSSSS